MKVVETISEVKRIRESTLSDCEKLGLIPTMGALHEGHLSLVRQAKRENEVVCVSIFVNPIQFNDKTDLQKYPRDLEADFKILEKILGENDFVFCPNQKEMYPEPVSKRFDFGFLENVMEGQYRPNHFNGVGIVVERLFRIIDPKRAYFGEKDYQQLAVIRKMAEIENLNLDIIGCPIIREDDGLAMSSRNRLLEPELRKEAYIIYRSISRARQIAKVKSVAQTKEEIKKSIQSKSGFVVEYVEFADGTNLRPVNSWDESDSIRCFAAVMAGSIRLIDNVVVKS
jgi:pantoate--beta-alanine ligase